MQDKKRLDTFLLENGYVDSRSRAKSFITGEREVKVNGELITKPSFLVSKNDNIQLIKNNDYEFVSRAGYKLDKAIKHWNLNLHNLTCLDIGASTGGFTEVCLINGAKKVISVDVGHDQLHKSLINNNKVINIEGFNFKNANNINIKEEIDFWCCDVSFISLKHIISPLIKLNLKDESFGVMLIKPQFESDKEDIKNGRAMSKQLHNKAIKKVLSIINENNLFAVDLIGSPIKGNKKNNIEYLILISKNKTDKNFKNITNEYIDKIINDTWD